MAIAYTIHDESRLIHIASDGRVTYEAVARCMGELYGSNPHATRYRELVDTREVERFDLSSEDIRQMVRIYRNLPEQQLTVLLATDPLIFGMGRMAQALSDFIGKPFAVVATLEEACTRLAIDPATLEPRSAE